MRLPSSSSRLSVVLGFLQIPSQHFESFLDEFFLRIGAVDHRLFFRTRRF
jgi:hypothetical protein